MLCGLFVFQQMAAVLRATSVPQDHWFEIIALMNQIRHVMSVYQQIWLEHTKCRSVTLLYNTRTPWPLGHAEVNIAYSNTRLYMWYLYILHSNEWDSMVKMNATLIISRSWDKTGLHISYISKEMFHRSFKRALLF